MIQEFYYTSGAFFSKHCQCFLQSFAGFFLLLLNRNFFSFLHANLPANTCIKQSVTRKVIMLYFMTPWAWKTERTKKRYNEMGPRRIPLQYTIILLRSCIVIFSKIVFPAKHKQIQLLFLFCILVKRLFFFAHFCHFFEKSSQGFIENTLWLNKVLVIRSITYYLICENF